MSSETDLVFLYNAVKLFLVGRAENEEEKLRKNLEEVLAEIEGRNPTMLCCRAHVADAVKEKNRPKVIEVYLRTIQRRNHPRRKTICLHVWYVTMQFGPRSKSVRFRISAQAAKWLMRVRRLGLKDNPCVSCGVAP